MTDKFTITPEFANEVAGILGMTAEMRHEHGARLTGKTPDGAEREVFLHSGDYRGKHTATLYLPRQHLRYDQSSPSIGVNFARGAAVVAREIDRRLLSQENLALEADVLARKGRHEAYEAATRATVARLAALPDTQTVSHESDTVWSRYRQNGPRWEAKASGRAIHLKLSDLTPDQAEHIIRYLTPNA